MGYLRWQCDLLTFLPARFAVNEVLMPNYITKQKGNLMVAKKTINKLLLVACSLAAASSHASVAHLVLTGTPGDFITMEQTVDNIYSSADPLLIGNSAVFNNIGSSATPEADSIAFTFLRNPLLVQDDEHATLNFSSPKGLNIPISTGVTYVNAERDAFASFGVPGLAISYDHRGCNTLSGDFTVNQLTFSNDAIDQFSVSFNQSCDGGPLMSGSFTYDADATSAVPEPATPVLVGLGIVGLGFVRRRKENGGVESLRHAALHCM